MSPQRSRVAALTLLCALAFASRANATAAPDGGEAEQSPAMTLEQAADWLDAATATREAAEEPGPSDAEPHPSSAAIRAGSAPAALSDVSWGHAAQQFARGALYLPHSLVDGFAEL